MFRAGEAEHRVIYSYEELRMVPLETAGQWLFAQILDDVVANELPKLAR